MSDGRAPPARPTTLIVHVVSSTVTSASSRSGATGGGGASTAAMARTGVGFVARESSSPAFSALLTEGGRAGFGGPGWRTPSRGSEESVIWQEGCRVETKPPY